MCFFQDIFLSISLILCFYWIYTFYVLKDLSRKKIENYILFLLGSFSICFFLPSLVRYFFLDLFVLLAYLEKRYMEGILLSFVIVFCFFCIGGFPWVALFFLLFCYLGIFLFLSYGKERKSEFCLLLKGFFLATLLSQNNIDPIFSYSILFFLLLVEKLFLVYFVPQILSTSDHEHTMTELEKNLFKITHEIKNPIAVCKGYLDMMDVDDSEKMRKYLPIIKNEIARTLVIMEDFMSIRSVAIHPDIMDFYLLMEDIEGTVQFLLKRHQCLLNVPTGEEELFIYADYDRLKQVFINLIKNSVEAGATMIEIKVQVKKGNLIVMVVDTGCGISKEALSHLGELFYTTKPVGTGVGVHLSEEIIRLHHGHMKYQSKVGKGTQVTLTLPMMEEFLDHKKN